MRMKVGALYRVEWEDSCSTGSLGWKPERDIRRLTPSRIVTIGKVVATGKRHVTLVSHWDEEGSMTGEMSIPLSCVRNRKRLL